MPEVVERETERTFEITDHTVRRIAVETGTSVLAKYDCVDCGASANSVLVFDQLDCETGELDRPEEFGESPPPVDMRALRDVEAIVDDLGSIEEVIDFERGPTDREITKYLRVEVEGSPGTYYLSPVIRDHDLRIVSAGVHPLGHLKVKLVPFEQGGRNA